MKYILIILIFSSCSANHHLRRANFHLRMAQAKGAVIKADTVYKTIPVITETKVYDTIVNRETLHDTLTIENVKYKVRLKYDTILKREYIQVECKGDTIYKEVPIQVPVTIEADDTKLRAFAIAGCLLSVLLLILLISTVKRK